MKKYIIAALLALISLPAFADYISCPELAQMIKDYEAEKKTGRMSASHAQTVNGILSATRKSYASAGCDKENSTTKEQK